MLLAEPPESRYDLRFNFLGFPVRIAWTFWLGALVIGHPLCQSLARALSGPEATGRFGIGPLLLVWILCVFLSILIHELGHALAFRRYGFNATIVLYHFGGLAVPHSSFQPGRSLRRMGEREDLIISAAGPALQLLSALVVILAVKLVGYQVAIFRGMPVVNQIPVFVDWVSSGERIESEGLFALVSLYLFPSVLWALLNLVPVWPLDGGRITRSVMLMSGGTIAQSLWISIIASAVLAMYAFQNQQPIMAIFFAMFGYGSYQQLNPMNNSWR